MGFTLCGQGGSGMKVYSWKTLLATIFLGGAGLIHAVYEVYRGRPSQISWAALFGYLIFQGLRASLTEAGAARDAENKKTGNRIYQKLFGKFAPVMRFGSMILLVIAALVALAAPQQYWAAWVSLGLMLAAAVYQVWLFIIVRRELNREKVPQAE